LTEKEPIFSVKKATVKKDGDKYLLISQKGKVLGTHDSAKKAWAQEYAIQKSKEEQEKSASVVVNDPQLDRPLTGDRIPNINQIARKDAGVRSEYMGIGSAPSSLPTSERTLWRAEQAKQASIRYEVDALNQLISDQQEVMRKVAGDLAYTFRTDPSFVWGAAKADALVLNKEAAETAIPILENYLGGLSGPRKIEFEKEAHEQTQRLVEDRYNVMPVITAVAEAVGEIEKLAQYQEYVKKQGGAGIFNPRSRKQQEEDEGVPAGGEEWNPGGGDPGDDPASNSAEGDLEIVVPSGQGPLSKLEDMLIPPEDVERSPKEKNEDLGRGIDKTFAGVSKGIEGLPGPMKATTDALDMVSKVAPKRKNKQEAIDTAVDETKAVTTLERLMLTDPIIRDAEPDMVVNLFNTLQNANPEVARDPNLLRFALRESLQYESVPLHTYKDLVETEERKNKSRDAGQRIDDRRYEI